MTLYAVEYDDPSDPGFGLDVCRLRAVSKEHALERFYEDDEGFRAKRIALVRDDLPRHRWTWSVVS